MDHQRIRGEIAVYSEAGWFDDCRAWKASPMKNNRRANTLLELIAASTVISIGLVPALRLMRDALAVGEQLETVDAMTTLCASRLEETLAKTCANCNTTPESGNYSSSGYPRLKYWV